jgi:hypothetical protein
MKLSPKEILDTIVTAFVIALFFVIGIMFLVITGCSTKSIDIRPTLEPTYQVTTNANGELEIIVQAKSKDLSMAINKAKFKAREEFAKHLQTNYLAGSRVAQQQFDTDESGLYHIATVKMVMSQ